MRNCRFREEQIVGIIQEYAAGAKVSEVGPEGGESGPSLRGMVVW